MVFKQQVVTPCCLTASILVPLKLIHNLLCHTASWIKILSPYKIFSFKKINIPLSQPHANALFFIQMENLCEYYTCLFHTLCVVLLLLHNSQNYSNFSIASCLLVVCVAVRNFTVCTAAVQDNTTKLHFKINSLTWHA